MDYMELQFPEDAREQSVREGRNISDAERWVSMAGGVGLAAYGINKGRLPGWALAGVGALLFRRGWSATVTPTRRSASTPPAPVKTRGKRLAAPPVSLSRKA